MIFISSCVRKHEKPAEVVVSKHEEVNVNDEVSELIKDQLEQYSIDSILIIDNDTLKTSKWILSVFTKNNFQPLFTDKQSLLPVADSLILFAKNSLRAGLFPPFDHIRKIEEKVHSFFSPESAINITRIYEANLLLSDLYFNLAVDLKFGMINDSTFSKSWKGNYKGIGEMSDSLYAAIKQNSIAPSLQAFEPQKEQYIFLKSHLNELIDTLAQLENFHSTEMSNVISDETTSSKTDSLFCHQLDSINYLVYKVAINMERIKWEKENYFDYYIRVNIPSNILKFYSCDTLTLTSKTISGRTETPSPSRLDSRITHFYIFPYWTVPLSIATKEILPKLKISNEYLAKHNMDVLDYKGNVLDIEKINWKKYSEKYFPFKLRQRDGDENTLGVIKFMFSNRYGIYLHDTNARNLFKKEKRALSHGCIRVEKATQLAGIISNCCVNNFGPDSLEYYLKIKERKQVNLKRPLPVQIRYYTAEADSSSIQFYNDTYFIDRKMINSFINQEEQKPEVVLTAK